MPVFHGDFAADEPADAGEVIEEFISFEGGAVL